MSSEIARLTLRFDGLDATSHQIDLYSLGESLQGFARILSTVGHFSATQEYSKNFSVHVVKTYAQEVRANCFSVDMVIDWASQNQIFSGSAGVALGSILSWIFSRNKNKTEEMKLLKEALDKAIEKLGNRDQEVIDRLASTIEKMAEELRPAARQAVYPIGQSCRTISIFEKGNSVPLGVIDEEDKEAISKLQDGEVTGVQEFDIVISELDKQKATCKVSVNGSDKRISASISDPLINTPDNVYYKTFVSNEILKVTGKAIIKDGDISKLVIIDAR
jgi:protein 40A